MKIKLEITVEVDDKEFENYENEDILNYCCNVLEMHFESADPTSLKKRLIWDESKVQEDSLKELREYWYNEKNWDDYQYGLEGLRDIVERIMEK